MIERYTPSCLKNLFSDESRFNTYLEIEIACCEANCKLGIVPISDLELIKKNAKVDVKRIKEIEELTKHDVVAFTRQISETLGEERRWIHYGLTSTDIVDTSLSLLYKKANDYIEQDLIKLIEEVKKKALVYKLTPCIGRTHGMHAEVTSFGLKWVSYYSELNNELKKFKDIRKDIEVCKLSGALGNYANINPYVQEYVSKKFNLTDASISTQVISRDRHQYYASILTIIGSTIERIATEIRNLSRSEIQEVEEGFASTQKGSSSMPQKRNPISSENLTGCSRMLRGYLLPILEDNSLYHERDISHSSVERVALIDMITLLTYMEERMAKVISNLNVFPSNMIRNIELTRGAIFSQRVLSTLISKGMIREEAYDLIQPLAMKASQRLIDFKDELSKIDIINKYLSKEELDELFTYDYYLKNVDYIYKKNNL